ncbi:hypothetical protein CN373_01140 [Bacillus cereus]|nr:hypothetical protein CN373_01140 [Bacillus cereus]PFR33149.1 hypothetical protein COK19_00140 [Bacillus cereus]PGZ16788.1 hypothetical protein COE46_11175 [Bacillus cereus]
MQILAKPTLVYLSYFSFLHYPINKTDSFSHLIMYSVHLNILKKELVLYHKKLFENTKKNKTTYLTKIYYFVYI